MKITSKTRKAIKGASQAHKAKTVAKTTTAAKKSTSSTKKQASVKVVNAALKALKVGESYVALLESNGETAARRVKYLGNAEFQLTQTNYGISYDGAKFFVSDDNKIEADFVGRLEVGNYICAKGGRASVRIMSESAFKALCNLRVHGELRGVKTSVLCYGKEDAHYLACWDMTGRKAGAQAHCFQVETARLKSNAIHFLSVSKFERVGGKRK